MVASWKSSGRWSKRSGSAVADKRTHREEHELLEQHQNLQAAVATMAFQHCQKRMSCRCSTVGLLCSRSDGILLTCSCSDVEKLRPI